MSSPFQIIRNETVRPMPGHHPLLGAGDEGARASLPRALLLVRGVQLAPDQGRPLRPEGRRGPVPAPLRDAHGGTGAVRYVHARPPPLPAAVPQPGVPPSRVGAAPRRRSRRQGALLQRRAHHAAAEGPAAEAQAQGPRGDDRQSR